ncbi:MAG TPA: LysR family transcriptional regulator, partial [Rhodocyclaceae bacterium]|nr:LysR family transcriptional regulator [Rhodocyclaceae bacterium]
MGSTPNPISILANAISFANKRTMRSNHLEIFCTLMVAGTMTRTAELLGVTQPAVSIAIAALEREIGFDLFRR